MMSDAQHLGFDGREHRLRMGLRPLSPDRWLEPDRHAEAQLREKARLLAERPAEVCHVAGDGAAERAVALLASSLVQAGVGPAPDPDSPARDLMAWAGSATQEDWCLMVREDAWRLRAACVCFPSRWVLADKLGATITKIHGPVPRYGPELSAPVERFMDRLSDDRPVWRLNWNLWDDPRLFQPREDPAAPSWPVPTAAEAADRVFLRVERQTLRRLDADAIAFGIRVHQRPLGRLVDQPGAIDLLQRTLRGLEGSPSGAKKLGRLQGAVETWVQDVAADQDR